jgi:cytochrome d ubiquinol oxidase subunit I
MPNILAARSQMAMSLAFHIIFSCIGIAMPLLMVAERQVMLSPTQAEIVALSAPGR